MSNYTRAMIANRADILKTLTDLEAQLDCLDSDMGRLEIQKVSIEKAVVAMRELVRNYDAEIAKG